MSKIEELRAAAITARRLIALSDTDKAGGERRWLPLTTAETIVTEQEQRIAELEAKLAESQLLGSLHCGVAICDAHDDKEIRQEILSAAALEASKPASQQRAIALPADALLSAYIQALQSPAEPPAGKGGEG